MRNQWENIWGETGSVRGRLWLNSEGLNRKYYLVDFTWEKGIDQLVREAYVSLV